MQAYCYYLNDFLAVLIISIDLVRGKNWKKLIQVTLSGIPFLGPILGIVNILLIFRGDRRCGHDLVANTRVVRYQAA